MYSTKEKKVVLHMVAALENGGAERQLIELLKINTHHILFTFTTTGIYQETLEKYNIKYYELNLNNSSLVFLKLFSIIKIVRTNKIDIIQGWMYNACLIASIIKKLFKTKQPLIWAIRCSDMNVKYYSIRLRIIIYLCKIISKKCDLIIYNSFSGKAYHKQMGYYDEKSTVIHNGVNSKKFKFSTNSRKRLRKKYFFKEKDIVIMCVGRVDPMKNHLALLKAFDRVITNKKNLKLVLIGKDTKNLNINHETIALGMKLDIEDYYSMGDIILLPSSFGEGFSNTLAEGMVSRLFPVATNVGDAKIIIKETGIIIKKPDVLIIEKSLRKISLMKKSSILKMAKKAEKRVIKNFNIEIMQEKYNQIYRDYF